MGNTQSLRLFYALWPDDAVRTDLQRLQVNLQGRKTPLDNLHVTLAFLGQQPAHLLPNLERILGELPQADMVLTLDRIAYFKRSRIAWVGMHQAPEALMSLQARLVQALQGEGIAFDERSKFTPHVTLARNAPQPADTPFTPVVWHATQIVLVQSILDARGSQYRVLASR